MAAVIDASVFMSHLLTDEHEMTQKAEDIFSHLIDHNIQIFAPAHFKLEIANALLISHRRKRLDTEELQSKLIHLDHFPITEHQPKLILIAKLAQKYNLTFYDAAYLQTAIERNVSDLFTFDKSLKRAAQKEGF